MSHTLTPSATTATATAPWHWILATAVGAAAMGAGGAALYLNQHHEPAAPTAVVAVPPALAAPAPVGVAQAPAPVLAPPAVSHSRQNKASARVNIAQTATKSIAARPTAEVGDATSARPAATPGALAWEQPAARAVCVGCGTVESVTPVAQEGKPSGMGAVAGAVLGGLLGNQFGGGDGKTLATIGGVVGGAYAGNTVEKRMHQQSSYRVLVRMDDGSTRSVEQSTPSFGVGARVSVQGNVLSPANPLPAQGT